MTEWREYKIGDLCDTISDTYKGNDSEVILINTSDVLEGKILNHETVPNKNLKGQFKKTFKTDDILYSEIRPGNKRFAYVDVGDTSLYIASTKLMVLRPNTSIVEPRFLFAILSSQGIINELQVRAESRSGTFPQITFGAELAPMKVRVPDRDAQKKIVSILEVFNGKIETNNQINRNLSEQLKTIFVETFAKEISDTKIGDGVALGELIEVIDNRGKTPPLTTDTVEFPIIDVGALRGDIRVIDFNNCTKFVNEDTYNNWFRSGHPKPWDILLSTVGSLAEMKIFLGEKGCIAQNVVALRSKGISPLYLFQYLQYIRNDLVAYNIGSVQPSIKVTHIIKHPFFVPEENRIKEFDEIARAITDQIYKLYCENEYLKGIRDSLLPKLMAGELDVSDFDI